VLNTYYICTKEAFQAHIGSFHPQLGAHGIDLPDGRILLSAHFPESHHSIETWEAREGVEPLPHPVFEGSAALGDKHVAALAHLGIKKGHTVLDVAKAAAGAHPLMKLRPF
jgi:hypothetical protein